MYSLIQNSCIINTLKQVRCGNISKGTDYCSTQQQYLLLKGLHMPLPQKYLSCSRYMDFIHKCSLVSYSPELIVHKHHIVPKHDGGTKISDDENIIILSVDDHIQAHKILYEEFGDLGDLTSIIYLQAQWANKKSKQDYKNYIDSLTIEQKQKLKLQRQENYKKWSEEKKQQRNKNVSNGHKNRKPEDKLKTSEKMRFIRTNFYNSLTKEQKQQITEKIKATQLKSDKKKISQNIKNALNKRSPEQNKIRWQKMAQTKIKNGNTNNLSRETRIQNGFKCWETRRKTGNTSNKWSSKITNEQRAEYVKKSWETRRKNQIAKIITNLILTKSFK